jgi:hypothetical protein
MWKVTIVRGEATVKNTEDWSRFVQQFKNSADAVGSLSAYGLISDAKRMQAEKDLSELNTGINTELNDDVTMEQLEAAGFHRKAQRSSATLWQNQP